EARGDQAVDPGADLEAAPREPAHVERARGLSPRPEVAAGREPQVPDREQVRGDPPTHLLGRSVQHHRFQLAHAGDLHRRDISWPGRRTTAMDGADLRHGPLDPEQPADEALLAVLVHMAGADGEVDDDELAFVLRALPGRSPAAVRGWIR